MKIAQVRKALVAGAAAGISAAIVALPDGLTTAEIGTIAAAVLVAGLAVFGISNAPAETGA